MPLLTSRFWSFYAKAKNVIAKNIVCYSRHQGEKGANVHWLLHSSLTRALERGAKNALPSGFSRIAKKRRRAAPPFFQYLLTIEFYTLCKNFNPRSPKVRPPGQVEVKNGFLTLRLRSGHTKYSIGIKPSAFHKIIDTYNLYISDFRYL